jgi:hypothetical protein
MVYQTHWYRTIDRNTPAQFSRKFPGIMDSAIKVVVRIIRKEMGSRASSANGEMFN